MEVRAIGEGDRSDGVEGAGAHGKEEGENSRPRPSLLSLSSLTSLITADKGVLGVRRVVHNTVRAYWA